MSWVISFLLQLKSQMTKNKIQTRLNERAGKLQNLKSNISNSFEFKYLSFVFYLFFEDWILSLVRKDNCPKFLKLDVA